MSSSKSKSSSSSNITDRRLGASDNAIVAAEGSQIVLTDNNALAYANAQSQAAIRAAESAAARANAVASTAIAENRKVIEGSYEVIYDTTDRSLKTVDSIVDDSFGFIENFTRETLKSVETANKSLSDVSASAINSVENATRSDAAQSFNQLMKTTAMVGVAIAVVFAVKK